jgi:L-ascorbate metabolism protein UlaG (beta-lactamase superfamily)
MRSRPAIAALLAVAAGCASAPQPEVLPLRAGTQPICLVPCGCTDPASLSIEYFGASGFRLRYREDEILLAPFFSNVSVLRAGPLGLRLRPDLDNLHRYLPDVSAVQAIVAGHAHYDHLLDVPHIARHHATDARVYTNETGAHILAADRLLDGRVESVNAVAWDRDGAETGSWIDVPGSHVRLLAIVSEHAPHFAGQKLLAGRVEENLARLPRSSRGWKEGRTFSFVIEFLDGAGRVAYRVFYQDAAANEWLGLPPESALPIDIAIPCVAAFQEVRGQPERMLENVRARHWMLSHWENFFRPYSQDPAAMEPVPATDVSAYLERLRAAGVSDDRWTLPVPGAHFLYRRCP